MRIFSPASSQSVEPSVPAALLLTVTMSSMFECSSAKMSVMIFVVLAGKRRSSLLRS